MPQVGLSTGYEAEGIEGTAITVQVTAPGALTMWHDESRLISEAASTLAQRLQRVLDALAEEQIESQRARHISAHGEKGITHG